jgi:hypothetical protein
MLGLFFGTWGIEAVCSEGKACAASSACQVSDGPDGLYVLR